MGLLQQPPPVAGGEMQFPVAPSQTLSDRDLGWLRYLYRKATTPDSWDKDGEPHEHWDDISTPPMLCFKRFDLIDSTYAVALMADITPAWREVSPGRFVARLM